jgi:hypothetical protein
MVDSDSGSESETETELVNALATALDAISVAANALESSPPVRRSQRRVSPDLPVAPELVKKTRKRKALVEDCREVDMGPRKLRSRK